MLENEVKKRPRLFPPETPEQRQERIKRFSKQAESDGYASNDGYGNNGEKPKRKKKK